MAVISRPHLIYVPGLGDSRVGGQQRAISTWRLWGVEAELFQMNWADKEPWEMKFYRLLEKIDSLASRYERVGLVGASAGAAAVIDAYAARKDKLIGCVLIAGKVNRPEAIGQHYHRSDPAFITAVADCQVALASLSSDDRRRILSIYALADETVLRADSRIPGARNRLAPSVEHVFTIATQLVFGAPFFIGFLKKLQAKV